MSPHASRALTFGICALLVVLGADQTAVADDTEIYLGQPTPSAATRPNIMFIIDTSGSMGTNVRTQEAYNPAVTYDGDCPADRIYWKNPAADLGSDPPVNRDCNLRRTNTDNVTGWIAASSFVCKTAADVIARTGYQPVTKTAQWRPRSNAANSAWTTLRRSENTNYVECADDTDLTKIATAHGDGGSRPYAANGTHGPFSNDANQLISWSASSETSGTYTYYSSNYLNWYFNARIVDKTRLEIIQEVAETTLSQLTDVNVGLMRFDTGAQGGMVLHEIADIATARTALIDKVRRLNDNGNTPLSETLYEAYLYFTGKRWDYGSSSSPSNSVSSSLDGSNYRSPISASCQKNFIVYLTDGEPTSDTGADSPSRILGVTDANSRNFNTVLGRTGNAACTNTTAGGGNTNGRCLDDLAEFMNKADLSTEAGIQNVTTYTIGFGADVQSVTWATDLLKQTARLGGGSFFEADDTASLTSVFTTIVQEILGENTMFTAPTVSVNAFNRTQNLNDLYITMFKASDRYRWVGNVKKYEVQPDGTVVGRNGPAINPATGFFRAGAQSFWNNITDADDVTLGGAAYRLPTPASRLVYTDIAGNNLSSDANNRVVRTNTTITDDMLGGLDATVTRAELIDWLRGADVDVPAYTTDPDTAPSRLSMGDPLHSRPATVIYGGNATNPDMVLYAATNDGYIHAIDPSNGNELWSYIPGPMLRRATELYLNRSQPAKRYGIDGNLRILKIDDNDNGIVDGADRVLLFFGMGRGGSSYYALDVTSKTAPTLLWRRGASTEINADGTFIPAAQQLSGLGQTWSTPVPTQVRVGTTTRNVIIFGGGYDPSQDNVGHNTDSIGNSVYMLDAFTGELIWSSANISFPSGTALQHSIPADIRVIDLDNNGLADRMYVADMGARIWRMDIHNGNAAASLVTAGKFASVGHADGAGTDPRDSRRFYNAPDVSLVRNEGQVFLNLAIGSGFRGHPLNRDIQDRFYSLRDYQPFTHRTQAQHNSFATITEANTTLVDVTTDINPTIPLGAAGWRISLDRANGEKVLGESRTFDNKILFSTYLPNQGQTTPSANSCVARQGLNRLYTVDVLNGAPVFNRDGSVGPDGTTTNPDEADDRWDDLAQGGIAPEPVILFPETSVPTCLVGVESCGVSLTNDPVRTFWNQKDADGGN